MSTTQGLSALIGLLFSLACAAQSDTVQEKEHNANKVILWSQPEKAIASEKKLIQKITQDSLKASAAQIIAVGYSILSQWDSAITYHYLSLKYAENANNPKLIAFAYNNLGLVHLKLQDTTQANIYLDLAEPYMLQTSNVNELGRFYRSKFLALPPSEIEKREFFVRKALAANTTGEDSSGMIAGYVALSELQPDSANFYLQKAEELLNTEKTPCDEVSIDFFKAEQLLRENKTAEAIPILERALIRTRELKACDGTETILLRLSEAYEETKDFEKARAYLRQYYDFLSKKNRAESRGTSSNNYLKLLNAELEKLRESHNSDLERIDEMNLEAEQAQLKLEYSKKLNWVILAALACLLVLIAVLLRTIRLKKRKQKQLNEGLENLQRAHTELSQTNKKLKSTQIQLIQSEKLNSIGVMVAGVAHEINNPLNYLQSGIYLLKTKEPNFSAEADKEEFREILGLMEKGVHEASSIVGNLKQFSRKSDFSTHAQINLNKTIKRSLQLLEHKIRRSVGEIQVTSSQSFDIFANEESVVQIFVNLISNALHASPKLDSISIYITQHEEKVQVEVKDQGVGISEENLSKIFDPFFTTKPVGEGTGLGLSIVLKLVEEQNGRIEVDSEVQQGTTFRVIFPLAPTSN